MPRKPLIRSAQFPYHITGRSNNREWFYIAPSTCWDIFVANLVEIQTRFRVEIISFVLMSNHYHLILKTPETDLDEVMRYFMRETSRAIARASHRINHVYGGRYKWCLITSPLYMVHAYKYVYRNPVDAGICARVEDYPYSTLQAKLAKIVLPLTLLSVSELPCEWLAWLNSSFEKPQRELIRCALRRLEFKFSRSRNTKRYFEQLDSGWI